MRSTPPPGTSVVKREDKSERIAEFIATALASLDAALPATVPAVVLIARSVESPVAVALAAREADFVARGIGVRAIYANLDAEATQSGWTLTGRASAFVSEIRWARDVRLLDAHEVLVIGATATWIGDCMRRDPEKRDSYEHQAPDCRPTAHQASVAFERIWARAEPLQIVSAARGPVADTGGSDADPAADLCSMAAAQDPETGFVSGTRH